jgi:hypothetical protein
MKRVLLIVCVIFLVGAGVLTAWMAAKGNHPPALPPFDSMQFTSADKSSSGELVMRGYNHPLTPADMEKVRSEVLAKWQGTLPEGPHPFALPDTSAGSPCIAFGYIINPDGKPVTYLGMVANANSTAETYTKAEDWMKTQTQGKNFQIIVSATAE